MQLTDKNIYMLARIARVKAAKLLFENEADRRKIVKGLAFDVCRNISTSLTNIGRELTSSRNNVNATFLTALDRQACKAADAHVISALIDVLTLTIVAKVDIDTWRRESKLRQITKSNMEKF